MVNQELPAPLTPANCELRDFPFMPLDIMRLRRSRAWLVCKRNPALAFYLINLWTASWHDVPAGSLEDDDDVLADLAMCDPTKWLDIKNDVLRGWVKCSDGRLYHPTVAEKVNDAWAAKLQQRWKTECARIKKHNDRNGTDVARPSFEEWTSQGCPQGQRLYVPRDTSGTSKRLLKDTHSKREGEGQGEREGYIYSSVSSGDDTGGIDRIDAGTSAEIVDFAQAAKDQESYSSEFETFWQAYPKRHRSSSKLDAWKAWRARLKSGAQPGALIQAAKNYALEMSATGKSGTEYVKLPATFLGPSEHWREYLQIQVRQSSPDGRQPGDFPDPICPGKWLNDRTHWRDGSLKANDR